MWFWSLLHLPDVFPHVVRLGPFSISIHFDMELLITVSLPGLLLEFWPSSPVIIGKKEEGLFSVQCCDEAITAGNGHIPPTPKTSTKSQTIMQHFSVSNKTPSHSVCLLY